MTSVKLYSKKRFASACVCIAIVIAAIVVQLLKGFRIDLTVLSIMLSIIAIRDMRKSFSKEAFQREVIEAHDERNELVAHRGDATAFKVVLHTSIVLEIATIGLYALTKEDMLLPAIIAFSVVVFVAFVSSIVSNMYYEKRI